MLQSLCLQQSEVEGTLEGGVGSNAKGAAAACKSADGPDPSLEGVPARAAASVTGLHKLRACSFQFDRKNTLKLSGRNNDGSWCGRGGIGACKTKCKPANTLSGVALEEISQDFGCRPLVIPRKQTCAQITANHKVWHRVWESTEYGKGIAIHRVWQSTGCSKPQGTAIHRVWHRVWQSTRVRHGCSNPQGMARGQQSAGYGNPQGMAIHRVLAKGNTFVHEACQGQQPKQQGHDKRWAGQQAQPAMRGPSCEGKSKAYVGHQTVCLKDKHNNSHCWH
eukprot:813995-Pelagomonas_calceolata.AAC.1